MYVLYKQTYLSIGLKSIDSGETVSIDYTISNFVCI